jgi:hypothetical protein
MSQHFEFCIIGVKASEEMRTKSNGAGTVSYNVDIEKAVSSLLWLYFSL